MVILFPAYSGIVGLPITAVLLRWSVDNSKTTGERTNTRELDLATVVLVLISIVLAVLSLPTFIEAITAGDHRGGPAGSWRSTAPLGPLRRPDR